MSNNTIKNVTETARRMSIDELKKMRGAIVQDKFAEKVIKDLPEQCPDFNALSIDYNADLKALEIDAFLPAKEAMQLKTIRDLQDMGALTKELETLMWSLRTKANETLTRMSEWQEKTYKPALAKALEEDQLARQLDIKANQERSEHQTEAMLTQRIAVQMVCDLLDFHPEDTDKAIAIIKGCFIKAGKFKYLVAGLNLDKKAIDHYIDVGKEKLATK